MFDIISSINTNRTWTHIQCFTTSTERVCLVLYKRNILGCAQLSLHDSKWHYDESSVQVTDNDIISVAYVRNQILVLDTRGNILQYISNSGMYNLDNVGLISCEMILSSCVLNSQPTLICISCDRNQSISMQSYNLETKSVKSCAFVKLISQSKTNYILRPVCRRGIEMVLIGCPDGSIVEYSPGGNGIEILHRCSESIVDIFQMEEVLYFVQSDGCLLEFSDSQVSMKYLPQSVPKHCLFMSPSRLVYSDVTSTLHYDLIESSLQELCVKGVLSLCHSHDHLFLLTMQGLVYALQDTTADRFLNKLTQLEALNEDLDRVDAELCALSIYTRAQQLKCRFMTRLCVTEGELDETYKFKLDITHTCEGVTFDKSSWVCFVSIANQHLVLPLSCDLQPGSVAQVMFVLTEYTPTSHVNMKIYLVSGRNSELRVPISDSILTLLSFCSPSPPTPSCPTLPHQHTIPLESGQGAREILPRALVSVRHTFTREKWEKLAVEKKVLLKFGKELLELCADERNRELLVRSSSEEVCKSVARVIQAGFVSAGFLYSDYLLLNSIKQQAEIEEFEEGDIDLDDMKRRVNELKSI